MAQRVPRRVLPYRREDAGAQHEARPAADQDPLRTEQVDQVRQPRAQVLRGLVQDLPRHRVPRTGRRQQGRQGFLLVHAVHRAAAALGPAGQQGFGSRVRLQAAQRPAPAAPAAYGDRQVAPLQRGPLRRPAVRRAVGDQARADARAEEHDHRVPGPAPRAEPHLRLAEGPRAVVDDVRDLRRQGSGGAQQLLQRDRVPADGLAVHHGPARRLAVHDARYADAHAQQPLRTDAGLGEHGGDALLDVVDDRADVVAAARQQREFGAGQFGQGQVEQLDADPGFADIDADHVGAAGRHAQQGAGPAAVRVDHAGLFQQPVRDEFADDVADGSGAQPGGGPQFLAAHRPAEVQPLENGAPVAPPQVPHRSSATPRGHPAPSAVASLATYPCATS